MPTGVYIRTEEHKARIRRSCIGINIGAIRTQETRLKISKSKKGQTNPNKGKTFSDEWKINLSLGHGGDGQIGKRYQKRLMYNRKRRIKKLNALGTHTLQEWEKLKLFYKNMCLCCKRFEPEITLSEDHIMPLSLGGTDYIDNIQPLCRTCNSRKNNKFISFLPSNHFNDLIYMEKGLVI